MQGINYSRWLWALVALIVIFVVAQIAINYPNYADTKQNREYYTFSYHYTDNSGGLEVINSGISCVAFDKREYRVDQVKELYLKTIKQKYGIKPQNLNSQKNCESKGFLGEPKNVLIAQNGELESNNALSYS